MSGSARANAPKAREYERANAVRADQRRERVRADDARRGCSDACAPTAHARVVVDAATQTRCNDERGADRKCKPPQGCQLSKTPPATMASIPSAMRRSKFSRKTNHTSRAVKTPSKLSSSDDEAAGVFFKPSINKTGPKTPPKKTVPASHDHCARGSAASAELRVLDKQKIFKKLL